MFFNVPDIQQFQANKEFIDTAVVPLLSLQFSDDKSKKSGSDAEYLMSLTAFIEQQFKGRLLMTPPFSYVDSLKPHLDLSLIEKELKDAGFKHVVFITCDADWVKKEEFHVIWLPAIPLTSMDIPVKQKIMEDQLKQVIPTLTNIWTKL